MASELHLRGVRVVSEDKTLMQCENAGEGNMNCSLPVQTHQRPIIVKQARLWVEVYPQLEAPWEWVLLETEFYRLLQAYRSIQYSLLL